MAIGTRRALHAGQAVVEALRGEGVERVFCLPGSHIHQVYDALREEPSIRLVTCKLESNVSLMADAYGRLTGRPGVCLLTAGPGASNSLPGVAQAYGAASPVVHITGAVPLNAHREPFHGVDDPEFTAEMFARVTKWSVRVRAIGELPSVMARAFSLARSGRPGPVHVEIPQFMDYTPYMLQPEPAHLAPYRPEPPEVIPPAPEDVERVARKLLRARFPVLCAGKGVLRKGATRELAELSRRIAAPVVCPQDAMGVIPDDHPFAAGHFAHTRSSPLFRPLLKRADLLLSIGLRAGTAEVERLKKYAPEDHILVGFDSAPDGRYAGEDEFVADPKLFLSALLEAIGGAVRPGGEELREEIARRKAERRAQVRAQVEPFRDAKPIHPGFLLETLASALARDAIVVSDVGNCQVWARYLIPVFTPESFLQSGVWNAMGFSLPTAIVAKMVHPERQVVAVVGDGAFLMSVGDFITACELGGNLLVVVLNDGSYGQFRLQQKGLYGKTYGCDFASPDFAGIARACGALGLRVEEPRELPGAISEALSARTPAILDVLTGEYPYPPEPKE